jgi:hypothetical protein
MVTKNNSHVSNSYYPIHKLNTYVVRICVMLVSPCHHGMARRRVVDGGDGLQMWRVDANILNKQSRTHEMVFQVGDWARYYLLLTL